MRFVDQFDDTFADPERDVPNTRLVHLDNGRTFKLERKDPYGFVSIVWDKGAVPKEISGIYTNFDLATKALSLYIANNLFAHETAEPVEKVPPLKYKERFRDKVTGENLVIG